MIPRGRCGGGGPAGGGAPSPGGGGGGGGAGPPGGAPPRPSPLEPGGVAIARLRPAGGSVELPASRPGVAVVIQGSGPELGPVEPNAVPQAAVLVGIDPHATATRDDGHCS